MQDVIKIRGAREHNLQNIDIDIPKNKFVVITGVSGSGKSSLAFDTIYAEGQRRYVESLSAYARQFLGVMDKPDVDRIDGLSPSISIDQKTASHNPRSTVGTITEIYDYLRLLFARIGHPHCPNDGVEISRLSTDEVVKKMINKIQTELQKDKVKPATITIFSPVVREKKGEFKDLFENIQSKGYTTARVDGALRKTNEEIELAKTYKHSIDVQIDTFSLSFKDTRNEIFLDTIRKRITTDIEQSIALSDGLVILSINTTEELYSEKFSCPICGFSLSEIEPRMFSFNSPIGACEICKGIGTLFRVDPELVLNKQLSIQEGGIIPFTKFYFHETWYTRLLKTAVEEEGIDLNAPIRTLSKKDLDIILYGTGKTYRVHGTNRHGRPTVIHEVFNGIVAELERRYFENPGDGAFEIQRYMREETCHECKGARLKPEVLAITIDKKNISEVSTHSISDLIKYYETKVDGVMNEYETQVAKPILKEILVRLNFLSNVGLSYLTIARQAKTLSGGELQRIRLASQIGSGLTGVLYVLDEPSIGLHPKDVSALVKTLHNLKTLGNTLIVVEHDQETLESADYLVELGPMAGKQGGKLVFTGTLDQIKKSEKSLTGQYLAGKKSIQQKKHTNKTHLGSILLKGAKQFNLKDINIEIPLGKFIAVTGVSGSGKSTLITETLYPALKYHLDGFIHESMGDFKRLEGFQYLDHVYLVDQSPIGRTPRSNPATYIGFFDEIRELFAMTNEAKSKGFEKRRFSFNLKGGRCEKCQGAGVIKIEMQFLADVYVICDVCQGHRYNHETLEVTFRGKTIYDVLKMTVDEGISFFANHPTIYTKLQFLKDVGLGYIELGQQAPTFSGGEAQRIKLVNELSKKETGNTLYILDEPTTGLHFYDIEKLLHALYELTSRGNTVIVIEHNLDVIKNSEYIIDLGPDGGDGGGSVMYQGPTSGIASVKNSYTGQYLKKLL